MPNKKTGIKKAPGFSVSFQNRMLGGDSKSPETSKAKKIYKKSSDIKIGA